MTSQELDRKTLNIMLKKNKSFKVAYSITATIYWPIQL